MSDSANRIESIFAAAVALPPQQRGAYLDSECADAPQLRQQIDALLRAHDQANHLLDRPADGMHATALHLSQVQHPGEFIAGKYTLVEIIGEGGMGSVWRAKQTEPVKRFVAVKLIKAGMDSKQVLARFEAERQALALMDHPNIAKVLDGGLYQQRPYFVMELVKGVPITEYCDHCKMAPKERLELFVPVCQAIQHAHQKGIIHRDIKPSNVLVAMYDDKPVVKVIDFGVAKATGGELTEVTLDTGFGAVVGTPQYMSPEQATFNNIDIDTRTDVYALGVLLYELLTGSTPFSQKELEKRGLLEMLRVVREEEPPRPSTKLSSAEALPTLSANRGTEPKKLTGLLKNELDWIVMKALEKDRARRYETANGFAADVQRYLGGEPVQAHPPSTTYRLKKFVRRNKGQVLAAGLVFFSLLAGMIGTSLGYFEAKKQEKNARQEVIEKDKARLAEAKQREEAEKATRQAIQALGLFTDELMEKQIGSKTKLSENEKSILQSALKQWEIFAQSRSNSIESLDMQSSGLSRIAKLQKKLGLITEAEANLRKAIAIEERLQTAAPTNPIYRSNVALFQDQLGRFLMEAGRFPEAEKLFLLALETSTQLVRDFPEGGMHLRTLARSYEELGNIYQITGKLTEAEAQYRQSLAHIEKLAENLASDPWLRESTGVSHNNLGLLLGQLGKPTEAEREFRKAVAIGNKLAAEFPDNIQYQSQLVAYYTNLGALLFDSRNPDEAEEQFNRSLAVARKLADQYPLRPDFRAALAASEANVGALLTMIGKFDLAENHIRKCLELNQKLTHEFPGVPDYRLEEGKVRTNLAAFLSNRGRMADAAEVEEQYSLGLAILDKLADDFHEAHEYQNEAAKNHADLGAYLVERNRLDDAAAQYRRGIALMLPLVEKQPNVTEYRIRLAHTHRSLGVALAIANRKDESTEHFLAAVRIWERLGADFEAVPDYKIEFANTCEKLGRCLLENGKVAEGLAWIDKSIEKLIPLLALNSTLLPVRSNLCLSYSSRADAYRELSRLDEALADYSKAIELSPKEELPGIRSARAAALLQAGQTAEAMAEAAELTKSSNLTADQWYNFACLYSVASGKVAEKKDEYAKRAIELLQQAVKAGFKDTAHIRQDTDLDPLRDREDFKKLLADLETKNSPP